MDRCKVICTLLCVTGYSYWIVLLFCFIWTVSILTSRVVADDERSFALGLQSSIGRVFGSIPGPLLFGAVFDSVCIKWQDVCGRNGNCWIYDTERLSKEALYFTLPCVCIAAALSFFAWVLYPKSKRTTSDNITDLQVTSNNDEEDFIDSNSNVWINRK